MGPLGRRYAFGPTLVLIAALSAFATTAKAAAAPSSDYNVNGMDSKPEPTFVTQGETYRIVTGSTVVLPCKVNNLENYKLAWKRGIAVLSAGSFIVSPDERLHLVKGFDLEIQNVEPQDAGDYVCQIGVRQPREISHTLEILVPPRIHFVSNDGKFEVKKGSTVTLECKASGNPVPTITWSRKNNLLPSGEQSVEGFSITIEHVTRNQAGTYECTADNKVGKPVTREIILNILYPPEIEVERTWVHSGEGLEAQLVCLVHAEPPAEVLWFRNTLRLETTERHITESRGSRHTLLLRKVHSTDFGNYSCLADNNLGKTRQYVELSGRPNPAEFTSEPLSRYRDSYNISWSVVSYSPVEEYKLYYRKLPVSELQPSPRQQQSKRSEVDNDTYGIMHGGRNHLGDGRGHMGMSYVGDGRGAWHMMIVQPGPIGAMVSSSALSANKGHNNQNHAFTHWGSFMLKDLEPGYNYEAKVQARNRYGWGEPSKRFTFSIRGSEPEVMDLEMTAASSGGNGMRGIGEATAIKPPFEFTFALVLISLMAWT